MRIIEWLVETASFLARLTNRRRSAAARREVIVADAHDSRGNVYPLW